MVLQPYLHALRHARIRNAPPWPKAARDFMRNNGLKTLLGWYDGPDDEDGARIYLNLRHPGHRDPEELADTLAEELIHHVHNDLNDPAAKAKAASILQYSRFRAEVLSRLLGLKML